MFIRDESFFQYIKLYPMITSIIAIHLILFFMMYIPIIPHNLVFLHLAGVNSNIAEGEYWRLVSPIFLHNDFMHLLFNSLSIIIFAPYLEKSFGSWKFLCIYLFCGIMANVATFLFQPLPYTHVGASGAIFGLLGIYLALIIRRKNTIHKQNQQIIIPIIALSVIMTFLNTNINVTAHIFGLITGFLIGLYMFRNHKQNHYHFV